MNQVYILIIFMLLLVILILACVVGIYKSQLKFWKSEAFKATEEHSKFLDDTIKHLKARQ